MPISQSRRERIKADPADSTANDSKIAIIGMACRFPGGANSPAEYWRLLAEGGDANQEIPSDRWSIERFYNPDRDLPGKTYVRRGGFLHQRIDQFDAAFFGLSSREAMLLDPQQRLLLEVTWEAFEDSGIVPEAIRGTKTGVYIGGFTLDNQIHLLNVHNRDIITTHTAIGSTMAMLSGRLSYTFDLRGPSLSVDTACSSSLVSLHLACRALLQGECEMAVSGGVNVMLRPEYFIAMSKGGFLSPDSLCKAFDASGDGYGRGEGAGIVVLKKLSAARHDGDPIRGVILATGINQDGRTDGITMPNVEAQRVLIRDVRVQSGISADAIQYVEAHGTGTRVGDAVETSALGSELAMQRSGVEPLWLGSVKTNIGHLEAASGVASVIKTVLALEYKLIPPNLHFKEPRSDIDFAGLRLRVPIRLEAWPEHTDTACAAINSFGYGGSNAHAILQAAHRLESATAAAPPIRRPLVFPISAATETALKSRICQFAQVLRDNPALNLNDLGYTMARRRTHHPHRLGVVAVSGSELAQELDRFVNVNSTDLIPALAPKIARVQNRVAFVYTGMGPQFYGMGEDLLDEPLAREVFERCDRLWLPLAGWSLQSLFEGQNGQPMTAPEHSQPMNFVLQLMLTELACSYGLTPSGVVGHSVGEIAAACVSGSLDLENAIALIYHRSRLMGQLAGKGAMLAVGLPLEEVFPYLKTVEGRAEIAAINSPLSVTLAGDKDAIIWLNEVLTVEEVFSRVLKVEVAYHSHHMEQLASEFESCLGGLICRPPVIPLFSSVTGGLIERDSQNMPYWWRNAREPVRFANAVTAMIGDGFTTFVEVGPHPVLKEALDTCLRRADVQGQAFALQRRDNKGIIPLATVVAQLYSVGVAVDWAKQFPCGQLLALPSYPWDRETLWLETEASRADRLGRMGHPLLTQKMDEAQSIWEGELSGQSHRFLLDHRVQDEAILPGAAFIEMGLIAKVSKGESIAIEGLGFQRTLAVERTPFVRLHLDSDGSRFNIYSRGPGQAPWILNASGRLLSVPAPALSKPIDHGVIALSCPTPVDTDALYEQCGRLGLHYGLSFRCLRSGVKGENEIFTRIEIKPEYADASADYYIHPTMLDAALQTLLALRIEEMAQRQVIFLPVEIAQIRFQHKFGNAGWCHAKIIRQNGECIEADLVLYDDSGRISLELIGVTVRSVESARPEESLGSNLLYQTEWHRQDTKQGAEFLGKTWLVFCDTGQIGGQIVKDARRHRISCITVYPGTGFKQHNENWFEIRRESKEDFVRLLESMDVEKLDMALYLWSLDSLELLTTDATRLVTGLTDVIDVTLLVQALEPRRGIEGFGLCLLTARSQGVGDSPASGAPGQHALLGLGRCLSLEKPGLGLRMIDLNSCQPLVVSATVLGELLSETQETEVAFRDGLRYVPRIVPWDGKQHRTTFSDPAMGFIMKTVRTGDRKPEFHEMSRIAPRANEVEVSVRICAISLLADTLIASNLLVQRDEGHSGLEVRAVGIISAIGMEIKDLALGDEVIVLRSLSEMASHLTLARSQVLAKPSGLSLFQCVNIFDWAHAYHMLFNLGELANARSILVHRAETGIGAAALCLARWKGVATFVTASVTDKQAEFQQLLGPDRVSDARSLKFVDDLSTFTAEEGIDVVLSSAIGDLREKSLSLTASGGRYLDISLPTGEGRAMLPLSVFERGVKYFRVNLRQLSRDYTETLGNAITLLAPLLASGELKFPEEHTFPANQAKLALEALVANEYIGKVVIDLQEQSVPISKRLSGPVLRSDAGYLLTGGFSGFGFETLKWLVNQGVRHIAVLSRSGPVLPEVIMKVEKFREQGIQIWIGKLDISDAVRLEEALREIDEVLPPLRGIIHSAAIIEDSAFDELDISSIERVMNSKALGAWNLHRAFSGRELDFFVCYSSITALLGNSGQMNYAAANSFLDGLSIFRKARGEVGLSINWGVIGDVGMVSRNPRVAERLRQIGLEAIDSDLALRVLEEALRERWSDCGVFRIDWSRWRRLSSGYHPQERLSKVLASASDNPSPASAFKRRVINACQDDRFQLVYTEVAQQVCRVLKIHGSRVDAESNLIDLGIDSLMATEVSALLMEQTGVYFRPLLIVRGPTIAKITKHIIDEIFPSPL